MEENRNTQIHIIPFDLGCVFIDMLSVDNSNNLLYAKKFISELADSYKEENNNQIEVIDNLKLIYTGKLLSIVKIAVMIEILLQIGTKLNQAF